MRTLIFATLLVWLLTAAGHAAPLFPEPAVNEYFGYELARRLDRLVVDNNQEAVKTDVGWVIMTGRAAGPEVQLKGWVYTYFRRIPLVTKVKADGSGPTVRLNNHQTRRFLLDLHYALATRRDQACQGLDSPAELGRVLADWEAELIHAPCYEGHCDQHPAPDDSYGYPPPARRSLLDDLPRWRSYWH